MYFCHNNCEKKDIYEKKILYFFLLANELERLQVPVGGDQLTRVRFEFEGAKALRDGCHTVQERFDQLNPIIIELFHTLQDFIEVIS